MVAQLDCELGTMENISINSSCEIICDFETLYYLVKKDVLYMLKSCYFLLTSVINLAAFGLQLTELHLIIAHFIVNARQYRVVV